MPELGASAGGTLSLGRLNRRVFLGGAAGLAVATAAGPLPRVLGAEPQRWSEERADAWYGQQPWLVGSNYIPATAINQLEMWQAETFDPGRIDLELGWAESLGMNTARVFLHDLLWLQDAAGFRRRVDTFLAIAAKHRIRPLLVLFDSVWDPFPKPGTQLPPRPGVHNSGWVQSPGAVALQDPGAYPRLRAYVEGIVGTFGQDPRVLAWDVWNEPDNKNPGSYGHAEPAGKVELVEALLPQVYAWARGVGPTQPLTSGLWGGDWSAPDRMEKMWQVQIEQSDVISFHSYDPADGFERRVLQLKRYGRPVLCTEYMARPKGSTFDTILPLAKKYGVAAINWGLVAGKTQTFLPWDSWQRPYVTKEPPYVTVEPPVWFHEVFRTDGRAYREAEVRFIREQTGMPSPR